MSSSTMPVSRATNAHELLDEIACLILEEPRRYNQRIYIRNAIVSRSCDIIPRGIPMCGTVGCVAGWVRTLKGPPIEEYHSVGAQAKEIIGLNLPQSRELFDESALRYVLRPDEEMPNLQTRAYARLGARHIRAFMKKYETQLKAKSV